MLLPALKFAVFSFTPFLLLLWLTSTDLWSQLLSSVRLVSDNPSSLLYLLGSLLVLGEALAKSLTFNNLDLYSLDLISLTSVVEGVLSAPPPQQEVKDPVLLQVPEPLNHVPLRAPWLLSGLMLMGLNIYFPQLSWCPPSSPPLERCPSNPLGGILMVCLTQMGVKLSLAPLYCTGADLTGYRYPHLASSLGQGYVI
ncbi:hypothetical protein DSO57_1010641 [Entomophthora muscae]|uniref:Uncharacterized protein n=1 Tax=Entomophthora muscae TaxID=34485 RepID=A0ACC2S8K4_9FUNG|nr:hypothetical protein DSO57_1010641 [Entomophthora muscae]